MKVNTQNTKKILKEIEEDFDIHIPFSKKDYRNFSENFSLTDSFPKDVYQSYLQSYIYDNHIFAKIIEQIHTYSPFNVGTTCTPVLL